ncbi:hypothetical protein TruAng_008260 [Truncatella angustata]|nr:hypothetical protein TruAng_008260 [Truncatella angustata]
MMLVMKGNWLGPARLAGPMVRGRTRRDLRQLMPISRPAYRYFSQSTTKRSEEPQQEQPKAGNGAPTLLAKMVESAATTLASVVVLGAGFALAGYVYHKSYKALQLKKMENAFQPGDPVLTLAAIAKEVPSEPDQEHWIQRAEQAKIDAIVMGADKGHYHLIMGEKGSGKSSMLLEAMRKIEGDGCAMFEAHADLEIFRIRLGKALDYEFRKLLPFTVSWNVVPEDERKASVVGYEVNTSVDWDSRGKRRNYASVADPPTHLQMNIVKSGGVEPSHALTFAARNRFQEDSSWDEQ